MKTVIATHKSWNIENAHRLRDRFIDKHTVHIIYDRELLNYDYLCEYKPNYIFFPHWSYIIPSEIYENFNCVVFHMTNLPFGRGGSPLQNLIVRGYRDTKISAIKVEQGIDTGPVYMKSPLSLEGSAEEIYRRASNIVFEQMIPEFLANNLECHEQEGEVVEFRRRRPEDGNIKDTFSMTEIYDYIRMLDAEGYPNAYIEFGKYRLSFKNAAHNGNYIDAKVRIEAKNNE